MLSVMSRMSAADVRKWDTRPTERNVVPLVGSPFSTRTTSGHRAAVRAQAMLPPMVAPPSPTPAASPRIGPAPPASAGIASGEHFLEDAPVHAPRVHPRQAAERGHQVDGPPAPDLAARSHARPGHEHRNALLVFRAVRAQPRLL